MSSRLLIALVTAGVMACRPSPPLQLVKPESATLAKPTLHVLSIGIEDYGLPALRQGGAVMDAQRLAARMPALAGTLFDVRVRRLQAETATREAVIAAMDSLEREVAPDDVLMLYFRGLGGPRFLVLADSLPLPPPPSAAGEQPPASFEARLLRAEVVGSWLARVATRQQVLVIESIEGASFFHALREQLAAPSGALRATKDLIAFATPGVPNVVDDSSGRHGALSAALLASLDEESRSTGVVLGSTLAQRVLDKLDAPIVLHQAGADLVLGAHESAAMVAAQALRDSTPWAACARDCARVSLIAVQNTYTLVGQAMGLDEQALIFVNGRRARREGEGFEAELPPAALTQAIQIRVLHADFSRYELTLQLP